MLQTFSVPRRGNSTSSNYLVPLSFVALFDTSSAHCTESVSPPFLWCEADFFASTNRFGNYLFIPAPHYIYCIVIEIQDELLCRNISLAVLSIPWLFTLVLYRLGPRNSSQSYKYELVLHCS